MSFPNSTEIFADKYYVHIDRDGFRIRKRFGIQPIFLFPLFDIFYAWGLQIQNILIKFVITSLVPGIVTPEMSMLLSIGSFLVMILFFMGIIYFVRKVRIWHGCEHKAIAAAEANDLDNIERYSTIHDSCGGTYLLSLYLGMAVWFTIIKSPVGVFSFMFIILFIESRFFHKYNRLGIWLGRKIQRITTKEPPNDLLSITRRGMSALLIRERNV
jgi:uncharacterized protein YqhQ